MEEARQLTKTSTETLNQLRQQIQQQLKELIDRIQSIKIDSKKSDACKKATEKVAKFIKRKTSIKIGSKKSDECKKATDKVAKIKFNPEEIKLNPEEIKSTFHNLIRNTQKQMLSLHSITRLTTCALKEIIEESKPSPANSKAQQKQTPQDILKEFQKQHRQILETYAPLEEFQKHHQTILENYLQSTLLFLQSFSMNLPLNATDLREKQLLTLLLSYMMQCIALPIEHSNHVMSFNNPMTVTKQEQCNAAKKHLIFTTMSTKLNFVILKRELIHNACNEKILEQLKTKFDQALKNHKSNDNSAIPASLLGQENLDTEHNHQNIPQSEQPISAGASCQQKHPLSIPTLQTKSRIEYLALEELSHQSSDPMSEQSNIEIKKEPDFTIEQPQEGLKKFKYSSLPSVRDLENAAKIIVENIYEPQESTSRNSLLHTKIKTPLKAKHKVALERQLPGTELSESQTSGIKSQHSNVGA